MTTQNRVPIFDNEDIDVSDFSPKPAAAGANREQVRAVAEPASFRSREPTVSPPKREPRRHRTGRNVQLNLKVRQEDADAFYALADEKGWVLGEAFQMAVEALQRSSDS
jgi:hypothetical protein